MPDWVANVSLVLAVALSAFNLWDKLDAKKKALKAPHSILFHQTDMTSMLVKIIFRMNTYLLS